MRSTDTPEHVIYECKEEEANRRVLVQELVKLGKRWPSQAAELVEVDTLELLKKFPNNVIKGRQQRTMSIPGQSNYTGMEGSECTR